jgi:hypothetical protein
MRQISEGKSAASFCRQMAAWFPYMFCNFYKVKNHKITKNSINTKARENNHRFGIFDECVSKFKNNQNLLNKIRYRFLLTTK